MTRWSRNSRPSWQSLALAMLVSGCEGGGTEGPGPVDPGPGLAGQYALVAPFTAYEGIQHDSAWGNYQLKVVATSGAFEITGDSTYLHTLKLDTYMDGQLVYQGRWGDHGRWQLSGDTLRFDSEYFENVAFRGSGGGQQLVVLQDLVGEGVMAAFPYQRQP